MNTQTKTTNMSSAEQTEEARLQEHTSLYVEDTSLPAEQIIIEQLDQQGYSPLFVP